MNNFWVEFKEDTEIGKITAGLEAVPAIDPTLEEDTWFFSANWGTTRRDLNNLQGRIETGSGRGSVSAIGVQADDSSSSSSGDSSSSGR